MFKDLTTKEHYEKYQKIADMSGISFENLDRILGYTKSDMILKYKENRHLNNIPLNQWDILASHMRIYYDKPLSLAEKVCLAKHCVVYQFIGAIPEFYTKYKYTETPIIIDD